MPDDVKITHYEALTPISETAPKPALESVSKTKQIALFAGLVSVVILAAVIFIIIIISNSDKNKDTNTANNATSTSAIITTTSNTKTTPKVLPTIDSALRIDKFKNITIGYPATWSISTHNDNSVYEILVPSSNAKSSLPVTDKLQVQLISRSAASDTLVSIDQYYYNIANNIGMTPIISAIDIAGLSGSFLEYTTATQSKTQMYIFLYEGIVYTYTITGRADQFTIFQDDIKSIIDSTRIDPNYVDVQSNLLLPTPICVAYDKTGVITDTNKDVYTVKLDPSFGNESVRIQMLYIDGSNPGAVQKGNPLKGDKVQITNSGNSCQVTLTKL